jgi:ATP-dependent helicase/nuclease subunit B
MPVAPMNLRFLLGPAGSGKTYRCLAEIRAALTALPHGPPLIMLAPKQATFQLERQLLADPGLPGYTRLQILSFERLASFILEKLRQPALALLADEGRVMALRALLAEKQKKLRLFHASSRLPGFAQELSQLLREFQHHRHPVARLESLAARLGESTVLGGKLHDLACLLRSYRAWLETRMLQDADSLLDLATEALTAARAEPQSDTATARGEPTPPSNSTSSQSSEFSISALWLDGFAEMTPQQIGLLSALLPRCGKATLAFCLAEPPNREPGWLSPWSLTARSYRKCLHQFRVIPDCEISTEVLSADPQQSRFSGNPVLDYVQANWCNSAQGNEQATAVFRRYVAKSEPQDSATSSVTHADDSETSVREALRGSLRVAVCTNPGMEAVLAAREILLFVKTGGRYRECAVLLRQFAGYHDALRRVFTRYEIPFFLDRRESVSHHPLAELTRYTLRLVAFGWRADDWFGALKTGLVHADETAIDDLENEALARGWQGAAWLQPLSIALETKRGWELERLRQALVPPFEQLAQALAAEDKSVPRDQTAPACHPSGTQLALALRAFWDAIDAGRTLQGWCDRPRTFEPRSASGSLPALHLAVWQQMQAWLDNVSLAFSDRRLPLRDWIPILEAGLAGLTVGAIPPALDQVLIGTIDRSRNPDLQLALVLGLNEAVFPAKPGTSGLFTETDRQRLQTEGLDLGPDQRALLGQERYYGYIALTRARRRLVLTYSVRDETERTLNPSPFLRHLQQLIPDVPTERVDAPPDWFAAEHPSELLPALMESTAQKNAADGLSKLFTLPSVAPLLDELKRLRTPPRADALSPVWAERLYGPVLNSSITRLEDFAACPFKYFISAGLAAEERERFELDAREQGSFQHLVLARFHQCLAQAGKRWRDLTPDEARDLIARMAAEVIAEFRDGLLRADAQNEFSARTLTGLLQDFIETIIRWMPQYRFDPTAVEVGFGTDRAGALPAWEIELGDGHRLALRGQIDRVDLFVDSAKQTAFAVVIDYKSGSRQLDPLLLQHGLQIQLPAYLSVLRRLAHPQQPFGVKKLVPVGVFYVNLRGRYSAAALRDEALGDLAEAQQKAYQHTGRFDEALLRTFDCRTDAKAGDQFRYRLKADGTPYQNNREMLPSEEFLRLLDQTEQHLQRMGRGIFAGTACVDPYQKGKLRACDHCGYQAICRIDPWTHAYRVLKETGVNSAAPANQLKAVG